ncbi:hypothetical protein [Streptomyces flaveolus]|uniref:hypothetical protein n=1 Tax=Streptomyces flaveolus TaxID=67297 RepID=UPI0016708136|nr:hypothetical protein [Streptomyces flaveolus]GGQ80942.1 hypothetical protein GCM10010216_48470 [Streptomyces flaveolus]
MQDQRRVEVLAKACATVGVALAGYGTVLDLTPAYRAGVLILITSVAACLHHMIRTATRAVMAHQSECTRSAVQERQQIAEMGMKAARFDMLTDVALEAKGDAEVVALPRPRDTPRMRRNGSA